MKITLIILQTVPIPVAITILTTTLPTIPVGSVPNSVPLITVTSVHLTPNAHTVWRAICSQTPPHPVCSSPRRHLLRVNVHLNIPSNALLVLLRVALNANNPTLSTGTTRGVVCKRSITA